MKILTVNATEQNGVISVKGTTEPGMLAVAISVYDKTGQTRVALRTTSVNDDNTFAYDIEIAEDTYQLCVADYNGGDCATVTVAVATEEEKEAIGSPDTGYEAIEQVAKEPAVVEPSTNAGASITAMVITATILVAFVAAYFWAKALKTKKTPR